MGKSDVAVKEAIHDHLVQRYGRNVYWRQYDAYGYLDLSQSIRIKVKFDILRLNVYPTTLEIGPELVTTWKQPEPFTVDLSDPGAIDSIVAYIDRANR